MVVLRVLQVAVTLWVNIKDHANSQRVGEVPQAGHSRRCELVLI